MSGKTPQFICHSDFANVTPINVFHKENSPSIAAETDPRYLNRHVVFRRRIDLPATERAILRITADDYYKLYINGSFVTQGPAPSYPSSYYYNELDVTEYLTQGENVFAVHVYYQGLVNRVWVSADRRQMLWFSLDCDGERMLVSDSDWLVGDHTAYSEMGRVGYDTAFLERYDSRAPECSFYLSDFDDSGWAHAAVSSVADHVLVPQPTENLRIYSIKPQKLTPIKGGFVADFGREAVGYPSVSAVGTSGATVVIKCGEELNPDGTVRHKMRCNCDYLEHWILSGGEDKLMQYDYKAFRYLQLEYPDGTDITDVSMTVRHYPYREAAEYNVSDPRLKQVLRLCADTVKYGVQEVYMDCPTREKGQYLGDLSVSGRAHTVLTGDTSMFKKAITDFCNTSVICPGIMAVSSCSLMQEIADYSLEFPSQIAWLYSIEGDPELLRRTEPYVSGMVKYFDGYRNSDGLIEGVFEKWNLVDWPDNLRDGYSFPLERPQKEKGMHNVLCARYVGFLQSVNEIYSALSLPEIRGVDEAKAAFIRNFYSPKLGLFCDDTSLTHAAVHSNIFPLLFEIGTDDEALRSRMLDFIEQKGLSSMGVYMAYYALAALVKWGRRSSAERLAVSEGCWMNMLSEGATTTFEAWGKDQKWNTSLFHPWATAPLIVFSEKTRIL